MKKITIIIPFLVIINITGFCQSITWFRSYVRQGDDVSNSIVQTPDNGYILVGQAMIGLCAMRLNAYGDTIWYRIFPGGAASDIIKTNDNNYIVLGGYSNVTKIDINGNILWTKGPFNLNVITVSIKEELIGNFILCGSKDTLGILAKPYLLKLNSNGNMIWERTYNTNIYFGEFASVSIAYDENYLLTGPYSNNDSINDKLFFTKTDTAGNPIFFYGYDTIKYCYGKFIYQTSLNSFVIGGRYGAGPFLTKVNASGTIQWFYRYINNYYNGCNGVTNTNDGGYAFTGWWDTAGTNIEHHAFLLKTDSSGIEQFRKVYLYASLDGNYGYDIKQTSDSGYIISGLRTNYNIYDIMVIKTDKNGFTQIIGIEPINTITPKYFKLYQNYPNPFNSITIVRFEIAVKSQVKIILCDILGRDVKKIVDEDLKAGTYEINFNASNLSSGVYYYSLYTGSFRETKKMILIK